MKVPDNSRAVKVDLNYKWQPSGKRNVLIDTEIINARFMHLMSKHVGIWMDTIDRIIYTDEFETMTEYNGFLTEV